MMTDKGKHKTTNNNGFANDSEATDIEMKGVAFTGVFALIIALGLIGAVLYAIL